MTAGKFRIMLWAVTVTMGALAALAAGWAFSPLERSGHLVGSSGFNSPASLPSQVLSSVDPAELEQLCQLDLRRPLHDPPPPAPPPPPPAQPLPPLTIRLSGTIIEPGHSQALIVMPDGSVELKNLGEIAGNARIEEIREGSITVEYYGQPKVLNVVEEPTN